MGINRGNSNTDDINVPTTRKNKKKTHGASFSCETKGRSKAYNEVDHLVFILLLV